jgi:outer membrane protein OmpA-like peptidoglycan-associated protein
MRRISIANGLLATFITTAHADPFVAVDLDGAVPVSSAQAGVFRPGIMPAAGAYIGGEALAVGARLRVGVLRDGPAPDDNHADPSLGGLGSFGLAMRARVHGLWLEGVVGAGVTGDDLVPVFEVGVGWQLAVGGLDIGPSARYVRLAAPQGMDTLGDAGIALVGVDVAFGRHRHHPHRIAAAAAPPVPLPPPPVTIEADHEVLVDRDTGCETDGEGCAPSAIAVVDDRIVLDERVLFDVDHARVKTRGRAMIAEIVALWQQHPEWARMTIEGHTDVRGDDAYNQDLSERRAERVRDVFVKLGVAVDRMTAIGYGRTRPRDAGTTEKAHQHNRRVEFVIERRQAP